MTHTQTPEALAGLAARLASLRSERKLSFFQLERRTGLARSHLFAIESGKVRNPNATTMLRIARGLDMSLDELFDFQPQVKVRCPVCSGEGWLFKELPSEEPTVSPQPMPDTMPTPVR